MPKLLLPVLLLLNLFLLSGPSRAEPPQLWLHYQTNLYVDKNIAEAEQIWRRAAAVGYSHVMLSDSKFAKLGDMDARYHANIARTRKIAEGLKLQIVPGLFSIGYSNDLLWHDPNLAEGLPVKDSLFVVKAGQAHIVADPPVSFPAKCDWKDPSVAMTGTTAVVQDNPANARFVYKLNVAPFRCYHVAVSIKTEGYTGEPRIQALADGRPLHHKDLGVARTQELREHHIVFNSLENRQVAIYFGVWGTAKGKLTWKNWRIEEVGLLNVLRRPGAPCIVKLDGGRALEEGKDYDPIADPKMGNQPWKGSYEVWHEPPSIKTRLGDGARLRVSWYHPTLIHSEQVMCCISEPAVWKLLEDQSKRMKQAWGNTAFMMHYDEIRTLNWDESCSARKLDAGPMLADHVRRAARLLEGSTLYTWSDMFDPHHNAHKDYYLVRGDLSGSWEGLDKNIVIVNWNFGKRDESLRFFADRGHRQLIAGYYDADPAQVRQWLASAAKVKGVVGVMYTTWRHNFADMEQFAKLVREPR